MLKPSVKTLRTGKGTLIYTMQRKKMKTLRVKVAGDEVLVSCGLTVPQKAVEDFLLKQLQWIEKAKKRQSGKKEGVIPESLADGEGFHFLGAPHTVLGVAAAKNSAGVKGNVLLLQMKNDTPETRRKLFSSWLSKNAEGIFEERYSAIYPAFSRAIGPKPVLVLRSLKSRWGSAHIKKRYVTLNTALVHAPVYLIDYVIAHEFAHFIHANHSKEYYTALSSYMPDWKQRKKALNDKYMARG